MGERELLLACVRCTGVSELHGWVCAARMSELHDGRTDNYVDDSCRKGNGFKSCNGKIYVDR